MSDLPKCLKTKSNWPADYIAKEVYDFQAPVLETPEKDDYEQRLECTSCRRLINPRLVRMEYIWINGQEFQKALEEPYQVCPHKDCNEYLGEIPPKY